MFGQRRNINYGHAMEHLRPGAKWTMKNPSGEDLNWEAIELIWDPSNSTSPPSLPELNAAITELEREEPKRVLREIRDHYLSQCDWVVARATELGEPVPAEWREYRQYLRDLPDNFTCVFDDDRFLVNLADIKTKP